MVRGVQPWAQPLGRGGHRLGWCGVHRPGQTCTHMQCVPEASQNAAVPVSWLAGCCWQAQGMFPLGRGSAAGKRARETALLHQGSHPPPTFVALFNPQKTPG